MKKVIKIKKALKGLQDINPELLSTGSALVSGGVEALTQSKSKYANQLKDNSQSLGKSIGAGVGVASNLLLPGLGGVVTPIATALGGVAQRLFQKDKLKQIKDSTLRQEAVDSTNDNISDTDITSLQKRQIMKKGVKSLSPTKLIEIEGKTTPEIHTDKNFNIKNLGSTPHTMGGNKVLAEKEDVVFPTQHSKVKFNKVMKAISTKDKTTLKKEQSKLPVDKSNSYQDGVKSVNKKKRDVLGLTDTINEQLLNNMSARNPISGKRTMMVGGKELSVNNNPKPLIYSSANNPKSVFSPLSKLTNTGFTEAPQAGEVDFNKLPQITKIGEKEASLSKVKEAEKRVISKPIAKAPGVVKNNPVVRKSNVKVNKTSVPANTLPSVKSVGGNNTSPLNLKDLETNDDRVNKMNNVKALTKVNNPDPLGSSQETPAASSTPLGKIDTNSVLEKLPIAYNIGQGLFGKVEKTQRNFLSPTLEKDSSASLNLDDNLRNKSNSLYSQDKSNARNLSSGNASNLRQNLQQATTNEFNRQQDINVNSIGRGVDINNRNTQIKNNAKLTNLQLTNQYNESDLQNKAAKGEMLSTGLTQLGQVASRNILQKNELESYKTMADAQAANTAYENVYDEDGKITGTKFKSPVLASPMIGAGVRRGRRSKYDINAKGVKSVKIK